MSEARAGTTYEYIRYMRDGSTEKRTGTVRSRSSGRKKSRKKRS